MFTTILVPLDGTPQAETALRPAAVLAERFGGRLILLVRSIDPDAWPAQEPPRLVSSAPSSARKTT